MNEALSEKVSRLLALLQFAAPASTELDRRVLRVERNIGLPVRVAMILILYYSFKFSPWISSVAYSLDVGLEVVGSLFWVYVGAVILGGLLLLIGNKLPMTAAKGTAVLLGLLDALFLAGLTLITGGYDSILYWVFLMLVVRNTFTEPLSPTRLIMNAFTAGCYLLAGVSDFVLAGSVDATTRTILGMNPAANPGEVLLVRTLLLVLVAVCGFGVQLLLERQRHAEEEAREFTLRENQLRSTGRLAAEIAHQLKNPLAIINNTTFSLQRAVVSGERDVSKFTDMIREEIERADQIMTKVMDYARLTEGTLEKLDVTAAMDTSVQSVFPENAGFDVTIHRDYPPILPPLMMQREHLQEILVNLLTNAREAASGPLVINLKARRVPEGGVEIVVTDNGPGIPRELQSRIFEAYYTTKTKGTGLGLAIVRNSVELYGGTIELESELGKWARFRLVLPATLSPPSRA